MFLDADRKTSIAKLERAELSLTDLRDEAVWWRHLGRERQRQFREFESFLASARRELDGSGTSEDKL